MQPRSGGLVQETAGYSLAVPPFFPLAPQPPRDDIPAESAPSEPVGAVLDSLPNPLQDSRVLVRPWWVDEAQQQLGLDNTSLSRKLEDLISSALTHSPLIQAAQVETQIVEAQVDETLGPFDAMAFVDSIFRDTSNPVGNTLTTGGPNRLNEIGTDNRAGLRQKNFRGGTAELTQELDFLDNNSIYFSPKQQASTKLRLGYTQPLMRGGGLEYNLSTIVVAEIAAEATAQSTLERIQKQVYDISVAYWELVNARAWYRQNRRAIAVLTELRNQLAGRGDLDSLQSQLWRADSAIAKLETVQARTLSHIAASEANLRAAIGSPELRDPLQIELIPATEPLDWKQTIVLQQELANALNQHPRIHAIKLNLQATRVKLNVAEQDLRPTLNLVVDGYLRGLQGDYQAGQSWVDQFGTGPPSYSGGLVYQRPVRNLAAQAILRERRLELRRNLLELDQSLLDVEAAVVKAAADVDAAYQELESMARATLAVHYELQYLNDRWNDAFRDDTQKSLTLDQLLNAQLQLVQAENAWARAQSDHMIAIAKLRLATASLVVPTPP